MGFKSDKQRKGFFANQGVGNSQGLSPSMKKQLIEKGLKSGKLKIGNVKKVIVGDQSNPKFFKKVFTSEILAKSGIFSDEILPIKRDFAIDFVDLFPTDSKGNFISEHTKREKIALGKVMTRFNLKPPIQTKLKEHQIIN